MAAAASTSASVSISNLEFKPKRSEPDKAARGCDVYLICTPLKESLARIFFPVAGNEKFMHWSLLCIFEPDPDDDPPSDPEEAELGPERAVRLVELVVGELKAGEEFKPAPPPMGGGFPQPALFVETLGAIASYLAQSPEVKKSLEDVMFSMGTCVTGGYSDCDHAPGLIVRPDELGVKLLNEHPMRCTVSPFEMKQKAKAHEMNKTQYNAVTNNCQHWCLRMIEMLGCKDGEGGDADFTRFVPLDRAGGLPKILAGGAYSNLQSKMQKKFDKLQGKLPGKVDGKLDGKLDKLGGLFGSS